MRAQQEDHFDFSARPVGDGVFQLTAPPKRFRQYLVCGGERALLIDTGFGLGSLRDTLAPLTARRRECRVRRTAAPRSRLCALCRGMHV